jgi:hypothetical protein
MHKQHEGRSQLELASLNRGPLKCKPFLSGKAVASKLFAVRAAQLAEVNSALSQVKYATLLYFVVYGERGIGKLSLLDAATAATIGDQVENFDQYDLSIT